MTTLASKFGDYTEVYNGADVNFAARLPRGINLAGGYNIGNAVNVFLTFPGSTTLQPTQILPARLFKLSAQFDF